jgi:hypothetical protein
VYVFLALHRFFSISKPQGQKDWAVYLVTLYSWSD